jgi:NDP-sugar pyrophosphorylase family protein
MILAAGLGTRLGEITRTTPKALVDVAGMTALERVARQLIAAGADRLIVNVHHHAEQVIRHVHERNSFGVEVLFSHEEDAPLETGGGVLKAAPLFRRDAPFLLHNVDILSSADLRQLYDAHVGAGPAALATLAVSRRDSSRLLLFDEGGLFGRLNLRTDSRTEARPPRGATRTFAFAGIHVVSPRLLDLFTEQGAFSVMDSYMRLAAAGERILPHDVSAARWLEVGSPERLAAARQALASERTSE